jgi:hypothetical protein
MTIVISTQQSCLIFRKKLLKTLSCKQDYTKKLNLNKKQSAQR